MQLSLIRIQLWTLVGLVLGALVIAPDFATAAAKRTAPRGYHIVTVKKAGFRIAVPDKWGTVDFTGTKAERQRQRLAKRYPKLASVLERAKGVAANGTLALVAIDPKGNGDTPDATVDLDPNVSSLSTPDQYVAGQTRSPQFRDVSAEQTKVAGRDAVKVTSTRQIRLATGATADLRYTVFHFLGAKGKYTVVFTAADTKRQDAVLQKMIGSFTLLP